MKRDETCQTCASRCKGGLCKEMQRRGEPSPYVARKMKICGAYRPK